MKFTTLTRQATAVAFKDGKPRVRAVDAADLDAIRARIATGCKDTCGKLAQRHLLAINE